MKHLSESGQRVFDARYAQKNDQGQIIENFEQAVLRLAETAAIPESTENKPVWENRFANAIGNLLFVPSTPIWANMGKTDRPNQPGACFVLSVDDTLDSMYETLAHTATVFKSGGGVGYNFSTIRPKGCLVRSTKGKASGVVELIKLYDASSSMVMQGGVRRGASMGILNIDHPEIIDFINVKRDGGITNFNLSVGITDAFMEALEKDEEWHFSFDRWPAMIDEVPVKSIRAQELWQMIVEAAHACGDPGLIFVDRLQATNPVPKNFIDATNPCWTGDTEVLTVDGWQRFDQLAETGSTTVLTVDDSGKLKFRCMHNIRKTRENASVVKIPIRGEDALFCTPDHKLYLSDMSTKQAKDIRRGDALYMIGGGGALASDADLMVWQEDVYNGMVDETHRYFVRVGETAILSGNCGEQSLHPGESCLLGSINLANMLKANGDGYQVNWDLLKDTVQTGIRFLDNMIDVAEYPLDFITEKTKASRKVGLGYTGLHDMLIRMGLAYDSEEGREFAGTVVKAVQEAAHDYTRYLAGEKGCFPEWENSIYYPDDKRRNAACITVAPTGSVTTIAGCEGYGIEPIFAVAYTKDTDVAGSFEIFSPLFVEYCQKYDVSPEVMSEVARRGGCQGVEGLPEEIVRIFKGAQEITPEDHILMQSEVQKWVENAVSKTCNLPNNATLNDIDKCYRMAYDLNLKGITVFRDGCKAGVITVGEGGQAAPGELARGEIEPRPEDTRGMTHRLDTGCGKIYLTVNYHPKTGDVLETFITTGSDGGCLIYTEATSRLVSLAIRGGISVEQIAEQLGSTHACPAYQLARGRGKTLSPGKSCASAIARKLMEIKGKLDEKYTGVDATVVSDPNAMCPVCSTPMKRAEGCFVCGECGYAKC